MIKVKKIVRNALVTHIGRAKEKEQAKKKKKENGSKNDGARFSFIRIHYWYYLVFLFPAMVKMQYSYILKLVLC